MEQFSNNEVLYYPSIEIQSETWLKASLLFWDKIYRIVPDGYYPNDSDEIIIARDNGFIENINLNENDLKETAEAFSKFMETASCSPSGMKRPQYESRLHSDKIDSRLLPYFKQFSKTTDRDGFLKIPSRIANGYMFYLSNTVSSRRKMPKATDNPDMFAAMSFFDADGKVENYIANPDAEEIYSTLIIQNVIPKDIRSIKIEKIIEFNQKNKNEKSEFRSLINNFSEELSKVQDKDFALKKISKFRQDIEEKKYTRMELMQEFFKDFGTSYLTIGLPLSLACLYSVFTKPIDSYSGIAIGEAAGIGALVAIAPAGNELRKNWNKTKSNYYLELTRLLDSKAHSEHGEYNLGRSFGEFIND